MSEDNSFTFRRLLSGKNADERYATEGNVVVVERFQRGAGQGSEAGKAAKEGTWFSKVDRTTLVLAGLAVLAIGGSAYISQRKRSKKLDNQWQAREDMWREALENQPPDLS